MPPHTSLHFGAWQTARTLKLGHWHGVALMRLTLAFSGIAKRLAGSNGAAVTSGDDSNPSAWSLMSEGLFSQLAAANPIGLLGDHSEPLPESTELQTLDPT